MISYNDFIYLMEQRGYIIEKNVFMDESNSIIKTFPIDKGKTGKILELYCPENSIISACGKNHPGGCDSDYYCNIKCLDDNNKEPFQDFHRCTLLTQNHTAIVDIIVTKILREKINKIDKNIDNNINYIAEPILNFIRSKNEYEFPIWNGNYKNFHKEFLKNSFNLYGNEKMIVYTSEPDVNIKKIKFELKADIMSFQDFGIKRSEELIILDKDKITDITADYKSKIKIQN